MDTLTKYDFFKLFTYPELTMYNISKDSALRHFDMDFKFWYTKTIWVNDSLKQLELQGIPLSARRLNGNLTRITTTAEIENLGTILIYTLDENLRAIAREELTYAGGDEGIGYKRFGKFVNDTLYLGTDQTTKYDSHEIEHEMKFCLKFLKNRAIQRMENCPY